MFSSAPSTFREHIVNNRACVAEFAVLGDAICFESFLTSLYKLIKERTTNCRNQSDFGRRFLPNSWMCSSLLLTHSQLKGVFENNVERIPTQKLECKRTTRCKIYFLLGSSWCCGALQNDKKNQSHASVADVSVLKGITWNSRVPVDTVSNTLKALRLDESTVRVLWWQSLECFFCSSPQHAA